MSTSAGVVNATGTLDPNRYNLAIKVVFGSSKKPEEENTTTMDMQRRLSRRLFRKPPHNRKLLEN